MTYLCNFASACKVVSDKIAYAWCKHNSSVIRKMNESFLGPQHFETAFNFRCSERVKPNYFIKIDFAFS